MAESAQQKLSRIRPPRVHITYDVETGDAVKKKELPFVVGIMSDLSGASEKPLPKLKDRKFVEIDRDNFNKVMKSIEPRVEMTVENKLKDDNTKIGVDLKFKNIDDFSPVAVLKQVEPLNKLYEARKKLSDLLTKLDGNEDLDNLLQDVIANSENLESLKEQTAPAEPEGDGEEGE